MALYELDSFQLSDITNFESCYDDPLGNNLSHLNPIIQTIVTGQKPVPTDAGVLEVELDAELVLSLAPELGMLKIYEAANDSADRLAEWAQIVQDAPSVVSTSWGICEKLADPAEVAQENIFFMAAAGLRGQRACPTQTVVVPPLHRGTATPAALNLYQQLSIKVSSDLPVVVERPMYFSDTIPTAGGLTTGAASEVGAAAPGNDWLFAEGYTGTDFQEYLVLANFGTTASNASVILKYDNGHTQTIPVQVPALGRIYFDVNQANAHPTGSCDTGPCMPTSAVSAEVTASAPIVADRLMYFHYGPNHISGGTDVVGESGPASHSVYAFAEGYTANSFSEYLTLQNPTNNNEVVAVTFFADGDVIEQQMTVNAHSRRTVSVNALITPVAQAYPNMGTSSYSVSMTVQVLSMGGTIVAERPMYFDYHDSPGGTDVLGYTGG